MKKVILLSLVTIGIFASCGKDKTSTNGTTTTEKIQKKWRIVNSQDIQYVGTTNVVDTIMTTPGATSDSIEFKTNNMAVYEFFGMLDSVSYQILSDTKIVFDTDTFAINTLTANDFVMAYYNRVDTPHYDNIITLKR
jgi:hypothetical protein